MSLHAVDDIDDAVSVTVAFCRGLAPREWLKLALIALLSGGTAGASSFTWSSDFGGPGPTGGPGPGPGSGMAPGGLPALDAATVVAVVAALVALALVLGAVSATFQFVFVDALVERAVTVRRPFAAHWRDGVRVLAFEVALGLVVLLALVLTVGPLLAGLPVGVLFLLLLPVVGLLALLASVVSGFTRAFVVPIMYHEDVGVLTAWRRLLGVVRANPSEYGVFVVLNFALSLAGGVLVTIGVAIVAFAVALPVGLVFGLPFVLAGASGVLAWAWLGVGLLLGALAFLLGVGLVTAPVQAALRYYALLLLGDTAPALALVADQRLAAREA
ncbi:hypothetical protein J2752_000941 [Halarchaeum rubridurum]|uniref:Uncharacterized protein n=1 Tax=Halarchaeum rubridurum TaxID=489911 RepID=A0A830FTE4_9EURY|nr:hypothetical protein [Halarchaeum rubridurum]MBP1954060.1 hypothetical protein [Halarchaeum rubridurum]GGM57016.1 hypothetical protein GCM10009017_03990 [Halarchaeum rubridurum]